MDVPSPWQAWQATSPHIPEVEVIFPANRALLAAHLEVRRPLSHQMSSVSTAGNEPPLMNVNVISSPFLNSTDSRTMSIDTNNAVSALSSDAINSAFGARLRNIERSVNAQMDWLKLKQMKQDESIREVKNLITDLTSMIKRDRADIAYRRMSRKDGGG